jgi:hypothetical protein
MVFAGRADIMEVAERYGRYGHHFIADLLRDSGRLAAAAPEGRFQLLPITHIMGL